MLLLIFWGEEMALPECGDVPKACIKIGHKVMPKEETTVSVLIELSLCESHGTEKEANFESGMEN